MKNISMEVASINPSDFLLVRGISGVRPAAWSVQWPVV